MRYPQPHNAVVLLVAIASCAPQGGPAPLSQQDSAALRAIATADSAIVMSRNWDALAAEYTSDAIRMPPGAPAVVGRPAIHRFLEQMPPISYFAFHLVDLQGSGDVAYMRGAWAIRVAPPGAAAVSDSGKILVVLRRQADGKWLRVVDAWNSDAAARP